MTNQKLEKKLKNFRVLLLVTMAVSLLVIILHIFKASPWYRYLPAVIVLISSSVSLKSYLEMKKQFAEAEK